ncbi:glycosyltransferase family 2 protein [Rhodococcus sp. 15-649-1-2]|uniref:glycosyltransferase family 2 protein n=1 Tax=Rhodococcus sp. 114MFTsu3.1 TaxID=1172184 RepID=UPI0003729ED2|nr:MULTISPECIES: glycosyltransferase family A protein [unclassified Rhodococcus (in: high G+C Gram-positive bacteria)]OZE84921.1 glycosyltransferase family 2 protein [Rhodococcus sp. 15-649-1-2]
MTIGDLGVVIPAYRASATIGRAVRSAFDAGASEVVVVDDGSDDDTAERAERAGARCIRQPNSGASLARVRGGHAIGTDFVIFLDADDSLIPDGVRASVEKLRGDHDLVVAAGTVIGVGSDGSERPFPVRFNPVNSKTLLTFGHGPWPPCAAVVRRSAWTSAQTVEPAALAPRYAEDYELLIRLSLIGSIDVRNEPTCRYSLAGGKSVKSAQAAIEAKEAIRRYYAEHLGLEIEMMTRRRLAMAAAARRARAHWSSGERIAAAAQMAQWFAADPRYALAKLSTKPWKRN